MDDLTPFVRQYLEIKERHQDAILFFRMGDFYEMFFEDAVKAAPILEIALTSRGQLGGERIPLAGVPHHAADGYVEKLISHGFRVAICEQQENFKGKGLVPREVVQVVTPGVIVETGCLDARAPNFLLALTQKKGRFGLAWADISTGEFFISELEALAQVETELARVAPKELLLPGSQEPEPEIAAILSHTECLVTWLDDAPFELEDARDRILAHLEVSSLAAFDCDSFTLGLSAAGGVLHYLERTRPSGSVRIERLIPHRVADYLVLDEVSIKNLELFSTVREGKKSGSLLHLLDQTCTAMGGRLLRRMLTYPLLEPEGIKERLDRVEALHRSASLRQGIRAALSPVSDLERLLARVAARSASPRDLVALRRSLEQVPRLSALVKEQGVEALTVYAGLDPCPEVVELIARSILDEPSGAIKEGGIIREGYHAELDELLSLTRDGKSTIATLEAKEKARTGISSLKVRYNKVFGYYIEVTRANLDAVPLDYIRKQTLTGAERFITQELKELETKVLGADERRFELEYELFAEVREQINTQAVRIRRLAVLLADLDAMCSLAEVAARYHYVRPEVDRTEEIDIVGGRHPVVERALAKDRFQPNDVTLSCSRHQELIITGPNMAGKSTLMRQVALITLMAQVGSFVPAKKCRIGVVDRVFTRVGASDNLSRGQSTFMVEMTETAQILHFATRKSLVLLDEIGRGTSTFDGLSIAWAVAETLHDRIGCRTLFATHYHELAELAATRHRIKNFNVAVSEWGDQIVWLRQLREGVASKSYGIQVARLAGLPKEVIERAREVLGNLERGEYTEGGEPRLARRRDLRGGSRSGQMGLFAPPSVVKEAVLKLDINQLTPLEALSRLAELQALARSE